MGSQSMDVTCFDIHDSLLVMKPNSVNRNGM